MQRKRVYIAYTGGTIGMCKTPDGYAPAPGYLQEQIAAFPALRDPCMPEYTIHEYAPLLDSSNMTPDDWVKIAQDIAARYADYDGFIVLHGTDTMAYTASALPFMLHGLHKPVILTGSQIPLCEVRNDALGNLITVMLIAANYPIPEVCLYFGNKLFRGCRTVKVNALGFEAFASPNYPPLGEVGVEISIRPEALSNAGAPEPLKVLPIQAEPIAALRLFPGLAADIVSNLLLHPLKGLVLEAYGMGNGPTDNRQFIAALRDAAERGVVIVDCSQCLQGYVNLAGYATGSALAKVGVISGFDMTVEAALVKLYYLFSRGYDAATVRRLMQTNLCGELTPQSGERNETF